MKTLAEYQKLSRERILKKNNYKTVQMFVTAETDAQLVKLPKERGVTKREVLNFLEIK